MRSVSQIRVIRPPIGVLTVESTRVLVGKTGTDGPGFDGSGSDGPGSDGTPCKRNEKRIHSISDATRYSLCCLILPVIPVTDTVHVHVGWLVCTDSISRNSLQSLIRQ